VPESEMRPSFKVWQPVGFEGLELNKVSTNLSFQPRHVHEAYQIGLILRGGGTFDYRGAFRTVAAGCLAIVQAGEAHSCYTDEAGGWSYGILYVDSNLFEKVLLELTGRVGKTVYFSSLVFEHVGLARTVLNLFHSFERPTTRLEQETRFLYTFGEIVKACADEPPPTQAIKQEPKAVTLVKDHLRAHYRDEVSLAELADLTNLSRFYLHHVFTKTEGLTPFDYQMSVRIAAAKTSLLQGQPPAKVAVDTGFADQAHFTRAFKKHVGVTPGHYRSCLT
jgi:AraC-like DNA-binding protein